MVSRSNLMKNISMLYDEFEKVGFKEIQSGGQKDHMV